MNIITRVRIAIADWRERCQLRKLYSTMKKVGRNVHICRGYEILSPETVILEDNVWIGAGFFKNGRGEVHIGSGTIISKNVEIWTSNHNYDSVDLKMLPYDKRFMNKPVTIGENVWVGTHVIFVPGVSVGEGAVVGAGAVVAKDVPAGAVVGGNPAKILKYRNMEIYNRLKSEGKIYLDMEYDYDISSLRKSEYFSKKYFRTKF